MVFLCYAILSFALSPLALAALQFRSLRSLALPDLNHAGVATTTRNYSKVVLSCLQIEVIFKLC